MKKLTYLFFIFLFSINTHAQYGAADTAKIAKPFKIFDNLYYVGNEFVSAYLLVDGKDIVLIDAMYGKFVKDILPYCRELGLDPSHIRYILCTHAHYDHAEGAGYIKDSTHAKIGMTEADWQIADGSVKAAYTSVNNILKKDWVIHDNDSLVLKHTTIHFYETPGHTPGVLSIAFPVRDGNKTYHAFMFGGVGLNFEGVERTKMYLASVERIMAMKNIQVNISNHPDPGKIFEKQKLLAKRKAGEPNPFVAPEEFQEWLAELKTNAEKKLDAEIIKEHPKK